MNVIVLISKITQDFFSIPTIKAIIETNNERYPKINILSPPYVQNNFLCFSSEQSKNP